MAIKAIFWDFGGVITTSPFDSFNNYELKNDLPPDFIRSINAMNPKNNAWAKLEKNEIDIDEFDLLFLEESKNLGYPLSGKEILGLLKGEIRPEMVKALREIKGRLVQACLTNNILSLGAEFDDFDAVSIVNSNAPDVMRLFDFMIESSKVKIRKPEPEFYLLACQRAKVEPQEVVFLDDLGINLKPAKKLGMKTIKVSKAEDALKELQSFLTFPIL